MSKTRWITIPIISCLLVVATAAERPYIGYVYPAGGRQGTTFHIKLGGQGLDEVNQALVSGTGVDAKVLEYYRRLNPQEITVLNEQLKELRQAKRDTLVGKTALPAVLVQSRQTVTKPASQTTLLQNYEPAQIAARIERRLAEAVNMPACNAIANIVFLEVTIAAGAEPGAREIRLVTPKGGVSNPLVFHVGQEPEVLRKPMISASLQILGKEENALRKRPADEIEQQIVLPCTVNGQVASGEINRYRFNARKGQRLVLTTEARSLIPYIADAVPGWFQPVLAVYDDKGRELAYDDDFRFKPDPVILFEVLKDGEYTFTIADSIYRGREDFVYRVTVGELPFVTSIFPLGAQMGTVPKIEMKGWNLRNAVLSLPSKDAAPGRYGLSARVANLNGNLFPFAVDDLPEFGEKEPNNDRPKAQKIVLPIIVNGIINSPGDRDVFQFTGKKGQTVVAEVCARRLDSPLDSELKLTDASGKLLTFNDDHEDAGSGVNTHAADSYIKVNLPEDGNYFIQIADTAKSGGDEYGYRLRISEPRPDFELRIVPSSLMLRGKSSGGVDVRVFRKDGFSGQIKLVLKDPPEGFSAAPVTLASGQDMVRFNLQTSLIETKQPVSLRVEGQARIGIRDVSRLAVPAEDRMQAFLWRHLVPAQEFKVMVYDPNKEPATKRVSHVKSETVKGVVEATVADRTASKPKFSKQQVVGRLKQLRYLFEEGLLTDDFYARKVAECEAVQ